MSIICAVLSRSVMSLCNPVDSRPPGSSVHGASIGKNTGVGCHALLQGIFPTQGSNPGLPHCRWILYFLSHQGGPSWGVDYLILQICIKILVIYTYSEIVAFFFSVNFYEGSIHRYYKMHSGYTVAQSCLPLIYVNRITYFHFILLNKTLM